MQGLSPEPRARPAEGSSSPHAAATCRQQENEWVRKGEPSALEGQTWGALSGLGLQWRVRREWKTQAGGKEGRDDR